MLCGGRETSLRSSRSKVYIFWSFGITEPILSNFEIRRLLISPGKKAWAANFITAVLINRLHLTKYVILFPVVFSLL